MKYAIGNRINFVQLDTQFSDNIDLFITAFAGLNNNQIHKAISALLQIYMHAGNTTGYYLPVDKDNIMLQSKKFNIGVSELTKIYNLATERNIFDRKKYEKYKIITSENMQLSFFNAKARNQNWDVEPNYILNSVYEKLKSDNKYKNCVDKLNKIVNKNTSIEANGIEPNGIVINQDDDDITLEEFKLKHPKKCLGLPEGWLKPNGVKLSIISKAIEMSQKFLAVKNYMTLDRLANEFYEKVVAGWYDDSNYEKNIAKNEQKKTQNYTNRDYSNEDLNGVFDDLSEVEL